MSQYKCRICREDITDIKSPNLLSPCNCRGTLNYIHEKCFFQYIQHTHKDRCELCRIKFPQFPPLPSSPLPPPLRTDHQLHGGVADFIQNIHNIHDNVHLHPLQHFHHYRNTVLQILQILYHTLHHLSFTKKIIIPLETLITFGIVYCTICLILLYTFTENLLKKLHINNIIVSLAYFIFDKTIFICYNVEMLFRHHPKIILTFISLQILFYHINLVIFIIFNTSFAGFILAECLVMIAER